MMKEGRKKKEEGEKGVKEKRIFLLHKFSAHKVLTSVMVLYPLVSVLAGPARVNIISLSFVY